MLCGHRADDLHLYVLEQQLDKEEAVFVAEPHVYHPGWSHLGKEEVVDKIKGLIYGQAIGDAFGRQPFGVYRADHPTRSCCPFLPLGLATEFFNKQTCEDAYGPEGPKGYDDIVQDSHRSR